MHRPNPRDRALGVHAIVRLRLRDLHSNCDTSRKYTLFHFGIA
jgi:hypothetical protein